MNHIRNHQCIQRGSEVLQKLFINKDTQDIGKKKKRYFEDIKKNKETDKTRINKEEAQWRSIRWNEEATTFI